MLPPLTLSPQKQKQKTQEALVAWLVEEAERHPVYCVWEDLHWADPSTLELLGLLLDQVPTARMLVLLTARPEFTPPWSSRTHLTPLTLARLPRTQAGEMIEKVTGGKPLPAEVQQQIVSKTDGVPLFVEELTKMVLESGIVREQDGSYALTGPLPPLAIPTTLHDSLMARLDRLATVKEVAQMGATLGREFSYELIHAVSPGDETNLAASTDEAGGSRSALPAGAAAAGTLHLQACLDSGRGLSVVAQEQTAAVSPTDCPRVRRAISGDRKRRNPNCWPITTPRRGSASRPFPIGSRQGKEPSSARPMWKRSVTSQGAGVAQDPAGHSRARPARTHAANHPGRAVDSHQRLCGPGSGKSLHPGTGAVSAGGRDSSALPGAVQDCGRFI